LNRSILVSGADAFAAAIACQSAVAQAMGQARLWDEPGPCGRQCLIDIADRYLASLFADDCERRENGMITAGGSGESAFGGPRQGCNAQLDTRALSYIDSIDLRRVWIADEVTGLAFGISQFRQSMQDKTMDVYATNGRLTEREVDFSPFDLPAMHVFKIRGGKIHEIEAMGFMTPYLSENGWNPHLR
jgi:hypothetical protein